MNEILEDLGIQPKKVAPTPLPKAFIAPWAGLKWDAFTDTHKQQLAEHLASLEPDRAEAYRQYLRDFCGAPQEF